MSLTLNPRHSVQMPQEARLPDNTVSLPQLSKTQALELPASEMATPHETELLRSYLEAVQNIVLGRTPTLVTVPPLSTLGQWLTLYRAQLEHPIVQGWMREQKIDPTNLLAINPSTGTLTVTVRGEEKAFTLSDTSGWGQISGPLLAAAKVIAPGNSGQLRVGLRDGYIQIPAKVVADFEGIPLPATLAEGRAQIRQMEHKVAFDPIPSDDRSRPADSRSAQALQVQSQNAAKYYSAAPQALAYKRLAVEVGKNLPDTRAEAKKWAEALTLKLTGKVVDADTIYLNRFYSYNTPPTGDATPVTGWEHAAEEPYSSLRLPDALLKNFSEHDGIPGTLDAQAGLYTVGTGQSTKGGYGAHNEFPLEPSKLMHASWKTDFQAQMTQKIDNFWNVHAGNYETAIKGEFVYQARKQLDAAQARTPAERALQAPEEHFSREDYRLVMGAASNLALDENTPLTVEQLKTRAPAKGNVQVNALNIHGYTSNDIMRFSAPDGGRQVLYIPDAVPAFLTFGSLKKLDEWVVSQTKDPKKRASLMAHFPLLYHQDQTANFLSRLEKIAIPVLWFTHVGEKKDGLNTLFDKMATDKLKDPVVNDKHSKIEGDVFQEMASASKARMHSDADVVIKSNSEVNRDTWLNDITVAAGLMVKLAPIAAPVAGAAIVAGLTELTLGAEKASSGDTEAERNDGASKAFDGLLNTLFSVGANARPEDPFARIPKTELPPSELPVPAKLPDIEEPKAGPSSGNRPVANTPVPIPDSQSLIALAQHAAPEGEQLIKNATRDALGVYRMTDGSGVFRQFVRLTDETGTSRVFEISGRYRSGDTFAKIIDRNGAGLVVITPGRNSEWARAPADGGVRLWPWSRSASPTPSENLRSEFSDLFAQMDEQAVKQAKIFDELMNLDEATPYTPSTSDYAENGVLKRKLNISWSAPKEEYEIRESERAVPTPGSTGSYSHIFVADLNRSDYSVTGYTENGAFQVKLDADGDSVESLQLNRLKQFEKAIPDADLRARISEVAHQGSSAPANIDLLRNLKQGYSPKANKITYVIDHNPIENEAYVTAVIKWHLSDLRGDEMKVIPGIEMTSTRRFKISLGNEVSDNPYIIEEVAPTLLTASALESPVQ